MSLNKTDYLMVGVSIIDYVKDMEFDEIEALEEEVNKTGQIEMIYDYVSDEFCYVGKVLRSVDKWDNPEPLSFKWTELAHISGRVEMELRRLDNPILNNFLKGIKIIAFHRYL